MERVEHWDGFSSYSQVALGKDETYTYYDLTQYNKQKHKPNAKPLGAFLKRVRIEFSQLPHLSHLKTGKYQSYLRKEVRKREQEFCIAREANNQHVIGKSKLAKTNPRNRPDNPKKSLSKPLCHCRCGARRKEYREELKAYYSLYIIASAAYRSGAYDTEFPYGSIKPPLHGITA